MKLDELQNRQLVRARWGRAGTTGPRWSLWRPVQLTVQRHDNGHITLVALQSANWTEYTPYDIFAPTEGQKNAYLLVEDYYLEIEGLEYAPPPPRPVRGRR